MDKPMTMDDIRQAVPLWFEPGAIRFFNSRPGRIVYQGPGGVFFTSSEQFVGSDHVAMPRRYSVRQFHPATDTDRAHIGTVRDFNAMSRTEAVNLARTLARGEVNQS